MIRKSSGYRGRLGLIAMLFSAVLLSCSQITAPPDDLPPGSPKNFTLLGGGDGQASFRWTQSAEEDFRVYFVYRAIGAPNEFEKIIETTQNEFVDQFLSYEEIYYYYITAIDFAGNESTPSQTIGVQPINISAPTSPTNVIVFGHNYPNFNQLEFYLKWKTPNISDLMKYFIYRGTVPNFIPDATTLIDSTGVSIYYDRNVNVGDIYYYRISAMDLGRKESIASLPQSDIILVSPRLLSPSNRIEFRAPYNFSWQAVDKAISYRLFVAKSPLSDIVWTSGLTTELQAIYAGPEFEHGSLYYWWVGTYSKTSYLNEDGAAVEPDVNSRSDIWTFFVR